MPNFGDWIVNAQEPKFPPVDGKPAPDIQAAKAFEHPRFARRHQGRAYRIARNSRVSRGHNALTTLRSVLEPTQFPPDDSTRSPRPSEPPRAGGNRLRCVPCSRAAPRPPVLISCQLSKGSVKKS